MLSVAANSRLVTIAALFILAGTALVSVANAGEPGSGTYAAPSLNVPVGARLMASTDVVAGMEPDASMLFSNPAFLSGVPHSQLFFSTANWLEDLRLSSASAAFPLGKGYTFSTGSTLLYSGGLQGYDQALNVVTEENYFELSVVGSMSRHFDMGLSVGAGVSYIRQHLYNQDGNGYAFNLGGVYERGGYFVHAAALNIGGRVSFDDGEYAVDNRKIVGLGRAINAGWGMVRTGAQVVLSSSEPTRLEIAADYSPYHMFSFRAAMKELTGAQDGDIGLDAGFGIRYHKIALEYAFTSQEYFSNTHTFSVAFALGGWGGDMNRREETEELLRKGRTRETTKTTTDKVEKSPNIVTPQPTHIKKQPEIVKNVPSPAKEVKTVAPPAIQKAPVYLVVAGIHSWESSARAEAGSFKALGIKAEVGRVGEKFRVILGRFEKRKDALKMIRKFEKKSYQFNMVQE